MKIILIFVTVIACTALLSATYEWHLNANGIEVDDEGFPKPIYVDCDGNELENPIIGELAAMRADAKALGEKAEKKLMPLIEEYENLKWQRYELSIIPRKQTKEEHELQARLIEEIRLLHKKITEKKREEEKELGLAVEPEDGESVTSIVGLIKREFTKHPYRSTAIVLCGLTVVTLAVDVAVRGKKSLLGQLFYDEEVDMQDAVLDS